MIFKSSWKHSCHGSTDLLSTHIGDCKAGAVLPAGDATEASLVLNDAVGNAHLAAQCRQEEDELKKE